MSPNSKTPKNVPSKHVVNAVLFLPEDKFFVQLEDDICHKKKSAQRPCQKFSRGRIYTCLPIFGSDTKIFQLFSRSYRFFKFLSRYIDFSNFPLSWTPLFFMTRVVFLLYEKTHRNN